MKSHGFYRWLTVMTMLSLPVLAYAQGEATLSGTVTDSTGGALPGVTVRAVHEATGNSYEGVTDARGTYQMAVRIGAYRLTADLPGFAPVAQTVTLLVGQQAVVNLQMSLSGVQESVTVTGEAPLLNVTESSLGGNIDPRQMQELPIQGRNWLDLVMLAPGARVNAVVEQPSDQGAKGFASSRGQGDFQLNLDGQQVTSLITATVSEGQGKGQPKFSREAIAEFELLSSRFDATQGRSTALQVNVISKSGTNAPSGSFSGYFRDDSMNAADHVAKRVLPYEDQQFAGTLGGALRKDKLHFFAHYEYEREPLTLLSETPYPHFNADRTEPRTEHKSGIRVDAQFSPQTRFMVRGTHWTFERPSGAGFSTSTSNTTSDQLLATLTQVVSNRLVNEVKVGSGGYDTDISIRLKNPRARFRGVNGPGVQLQGLSIGGGNIFPNDFGQDSYSVRDDLTYSFSKGGRHTMKAGAEYLYTRVIDFRCITCEGRLVANRGPIPANIESLFPDLEDVTTWNLAPLSSISASWTQSFGEVSQSYIPKYSWGFWLQDDWSVSSRLTLNFGLRYDLELNAFSEKVGLEPFLKANRPNDINNVGPRTGFSFSLNDRTVIRGGYGAYFGTTTAARELSYDVQVLVIDTPNDGRPDFAVNPYNGPPPTFESVQATLCTPADPFKPGCRRRDIPWGGILYGPTHQMPYAHQVAVGLQRLLGPQMAVDADYVYTGTRDWPHSMPVNLTYNPATGANYPFSDISRRPYPDWGYVNLTMPGARANYHALQTAWTKRMGNGWQGSATYTLGVLRDAGPRPFDGLTYEPVPFPTAPDLGGEYGLAEADQRHRAVFNGIWQLPYAFQLSGLYFFGSGERYFTQWGNGIDLRQTGGRTKEEYRLRPNGTIIPRNAFVGKQIHRVDVRLQRRFPLGGRAGIDGIVEVFNLFNHANFGNYEIQEVRRDYGRPRQHTNVAYNPRTLQLGFRFAF